MIDGRIGHDEPEQAAQHRRSGVRPSDDNEGSVRNDLSYGGRVGVSAVLIKLCLFLMSIIHMQHNQQAYEVVEDILRHGSLLNSGGCAASAELAEPSFFSADW